MNEEWKPWRDGDYEVLLDGRMRRARPGRRTFVGRELCPLRLKNGYLGVRPVVNGKNVQVYLHAAIAEVFLGPRPEGHEVNHINGDKADPRACNLEYVTHAGNMRHAQNAGLLQTGERHWNARLSDDDARALRARRRGGEPLAALAREYGVARSTASQIANGVRRAP